MGTEFPLALEGQPPEHRVDVDDLAFRSSVQVAVRREGGAEIAGPALTGLHDVQEGVDVDRHRRRHPAGQHQLEVSPRQPVLPLEEKRARQLQAHPDQFRMIDQDEPEGGDGLVVQLPARIVAVGLPGCVEGRRADVEQDGGAVVVGAVWSFLGGGRRRQHQARQQGGQQNGHRVLVSISGDCRRRPLGGTDK